MSKMDTKKWIADFQAKQDAEDAKLSPEELVKVKAAREAKAAKYKALRIEAKVPMENVVTNGHKFLLSDLEHHPASKNAGQDLHVWGTKPDPDGESDREREGYISVDGTNYSCWRCGASMKFSYDEKTNSLFYTAERYEYPKNDVEPPDYHAEREKYYAWHKAQQAKIKTTFLSGPCEAKADMETVVRVSFPSGKVIANDSLRQVYDPDFDDYDYNSALGQAVAIKRNAAIGCAYFPVGNSCPGVYLRPDGTYVIGSPVFDDEADDFDKSNGWVEKARIGTNLWAASLADYEDWLDKGGDPFDENNKNEHRDLFNVEPGVYEFRYYCGREDWDEWGSGETIYADFKRIGDCSGEQE